MNFNFSPGVWANDGSKAVPPLRTISAGGVIEQPRSSALDPRGAQPPYGGFAALGAGFIQRPATDLFPLPTNTRLQLLGPPPPSAMPQALQYPIASIQPILQPPSAFLSAYGAQPAVRGGALGSGAALHGAQQPMQQISAAANAYAPAPPGYNARGGVANSLDAFMGQQRQSQKFYSPAVQALAPGIRPPAGIRCLPSVEARAGSMMTCAAGLTGAQQPATRRAQAGSGQVRGMAVAHT